MNILNVISFNVNGLGTLQNKKKHAILTKLKTLISPFYKKLTADHKMKKAGTIYGKVKFIITRYLPESWCSHSTSKSS